MILPLYHKCIYSTMDSSLPLAPHHHRVGSRASFQNPGATETRGECSPTTLTGEGVPRLTRRGRESATNALVLDCSFSRFRPKTEGKARSRREPPKERELRLPAIAYPKQSRMVDGPVLASLIPTSGSGKQGASAQTFLLQPAPAFFSGVAVLVATLLFFFWEISALEVSCFEILLLPASPIEAPFRPRPESLVSKRNG